MRTMLALFTMLLIGCGRGVSPLNYAEYIEKIDNGLTGGFVCDNQEWKITYRPPEYLALREFQSLDFDEDDFLNVLNKYRFYSCFNIHIVNSIPNNKDLKQSKQVSLRSIVENDVLQNLVMKAGNDTLLCRIVQMEPSDSSKKTFVAAFDKPVCTECNYELIYKQNNNSPKPLSFTITNQSLASIPALDF